MTGIGADGFGNPNHLIYLVVGSFFDGRPDDCTPTQD